MSTNRGVFLSESGLQRLKAARTRWEQAAGKRCTQDELCHLAQLSRTTISRILNGTGGVDRESIDRVFAALEISSSPDDLQTPGSNVQEDWGEAVDCRFFVGRQHEIQTLTHWINNQRCRFITLLGIGGMGKTSLSIKLMELLKNSFNAVVWRSLQAPSDLDSFLSDLLRSITREPSSKASVTPMDIIEVLRKQRSLIVLDNVDSLLESQCPPGTFSKEYFGYRDFLVKLASVHHHSTIIITSRERLIDLTALEGEKLPVRSLQLQPLSVQDTAEILRQKGIESNPDSLKPLVEKYGGNPLCIKLVANVIFETYSGDIDYFIKQSSGLFEGIRNVLENQFSRLTSLEQSLMYWLAIYREPVLLGTLEEGFIPYLSGSSLLEILESLTKRSLVEKVLNYQPKFNQQTVVSEFVITALISSWREEILGVKTVEVLRTHPIGYSKVSDHIQKSYQRSMITTLMSLLFNLGKQKLVKRMKQILKEEGEGGWEGYVAANVAVVTAELGISLCIHDFSSHFFRGISFQLMGLKNVNMRNCRFHDCFFAQPYSEVLGVDWHPKEPLLAMASGEGDVLLWSMKSESFQISTSHTSSIWCIKFSPSGNLMVTTSNDKSAKLWRYPFRHHFLCLQHNHKVYCATFDLSESHVITSCSDGVTRIWDISTGNVISAFDDQTDGTQSVAFSYNSKRIVTGGQNGKLYIRDHDTGSILHVVDAHQDCIRSIDVSGQDLIASASFDNTIKIWTIDGKLLREIRSHQDAVMAVRFNLEGNLLASASKDRHIGVWDVRSGSCSWCHQHSDWVRAICFSPDGKTLVSAGDDRTLRVWDVQDGSCKNVLNGYTNSVYSLQIHGDLIATGSQDKKIRLWGILPDCSIGPIKEVGNIHTEGSVLDISHDGNLIATNTLKETIQIWDYQEGKLVSQLNGHNHNVTAIAFGLQDRFLLSGDDRGWLCCWDIRKGSCLWASHLHNGWIWEIVSLTSEYVCSGSDDGTIRIWDPHGNCLEILTGHSQPVTGLAYNPKGLLVSCSFDLTTMVWDLSNPNQISDPLVLEGSTDVLWSVVLGEEGEVFSAGADKRIHCWVGGEHHCWDAHDRAITKLSISGDILVSASTDETVKIWDWREQKLLGRLQMPRVYEDLDLRGVEGLSPVDLISLQKLGALI